MSFAASLIGIVEGIKAVREIMVIGKETIVSVTEMMRDEKARKLITDIGSSYALLASAKGEGSEDAKRKVAQQISDIWSRA